MSHQWILHTLRAHGGHWSIGLLILVAAIILCSFAHKILVRILARVRRFRTADRSQILRIVSRIRRPAQFLVLLTGLGFVLPLLDIPTPYLGPAPEGSRSRVVHRSRLAHDRARLLLRRFPDPAL